MTLNRPRINMLLELALSGDDDAFGALASAVQDELFRLALALGLRREDAAEATQEVLLRAYAGRAAWKRGSDAMAWLCGIAINVARESHRKERQRRATTRDPSWCSPDSVRGIDGAPRYAERDSDQLQYLERALLELPPRQREAIACRYLRRMSIREAAAAMGCTEGTVKSAVSAALDKLRGLLEKHA